MGYISFLYIASSISIKANEGDEFSCTDDFRDFLDILTTKNLSYSVTYEGTFNEKVWDMLKKYQSKIITSIQWDPPKICSQDLKVILTSFPKLHFLYIGNNGSCGEKRHSIKVPENLKLAIHNNSIRKFIINNISLQPGQEQFFSSLIGMMKKLNTLRFYSISFPSKYYMEVVLSQAPKIIFDLEISWKGRQKPQADWLFDVLKEHNIDLWCLRLSFPDRDLCGLSDTQLYDLFNRRSLSIECQEQHHQKYFEIAIQCPQLTSFKLCALNNELKEKWNNTCEEFTENLKTTYRTLLLKFLPKFPTVLIDMIIKMTVQYRTRIKYY